MKFDSLFFALTIVLSSCSSNELTFPEIPIPSSKKIALSDQGMDYDEDFSISNNLILRIPAEYLSDFISSATKGITKFDSKSINTNNITEEYLDINVRIKNKKELEKRFIKLLEKANRVSDILEIERQIARLRSDIESKEGKIKYFDNRVSFSTLSMNFYQTIRNSEPHKNRFVEGFKRGWKNLLNFLLGIVGLWPFVILFIGLGIGIRYWRKKDRQ